MGRAFNAPRATTMGLRLLGLLEKSQPIKQACVKSGAPNDGSRGHELFEQCQGDDARHAVGVELCAL